jgi:hypothetical protein
VNDPAPAPLRTTEEAGIRLHQTPSGVRRLIRGGMLSAIQPAGPGRGRRPYFVTDAAIESFIAASRYHPTLPGLRRV